MVCLIKLNNAVLTEGVNVIVNTGAASPIPANKAAATSGLDYDPVSTTVMFGPGSAPVCIDIQINEDTADEPNEIFAVTAVSTNGQLTVTSPTATVCITDDDRM